MAPYWYISGFLLLISIVEILLKKDERTTHILTYLLCISAVTLVIFGGIRGLGTGMDDYQYRSFFADFINRLQINGFANTVAFYRYEPLIFALAYVTHLFSQNADVFLFVFCLLAVAINATFFKKMSPFPILALALYSAHIFINKDMNQIRFGLSSALFLGVIWYIYLKRYWMATTFAILSFLSHNTAVMVVSIVPFLFIRDSRWWPVAIILLSVPASKVGGTSFVSLISAHLGAIGERAENYNNQYATGAEGGVYSISNFKNILLVFIFVYFMLSNEIKKANYQQYRLNYLLILTFSLGGAIRIFFYNYSSGARLSNYLLQVEPVIISLLVYQVKPILKPAMFAMFAFFLVYYLYYNTISLKQAVVGYEVAQSFRLFH